MGWEAGAETALVRMAAKAAEVRVVATTVMVADEEMADVAVEPLYPPELASMSVPDFLAALPSLDADFTAKVSAAAAEGKVLRYGASVIPPSADNKAGSLTVGLLTVPADSPLGTLQGSDNLVEIYTKWCARLPPPL